MKFGQFTPDGSEYVISRPDTPRPWYNRFGNREYSVNLSQMAGGYSIAGDAHRYQLNYYVPRYDLSGKFIYLRDADTADFWGASFAPVRAPLDHFECRHGQGWSTFSSARDGIACTYTVFVPLTGAVELWNVTLTNLSGRRRRIMAVPAVEWSIDDAPQIVDELVYAAYLDGAYDARNAAVVGLRRDTPNYCFHRAFLAADFRPDGWDANRNAFLGRCGTQAAPEAIRTGRLTKTVAYAEASMAALSRTFTLGAGQSVTFHVMCGMADTAARARLRRRFFRPGACERELAAVRDFWNRMPETLSIRTPDRALDQWVNRWLVSHTYKAGTSSTVRPIRMNYRNIMQDALAMCYLDPASARRIILDGMRYQVSSGEAMLWWSSGCAWTDGPRHVDTKIWLVYAACAYVRETGDLAVLRHREPFHDTRRPASLLTRLHLICDKLWQDRGRHGLMLVGGGDWNDSLDGLGRGGRGESTWMSLAAHWAFTQAAEVDERLGDRRHAAELRRRARTLRTAIHRWAWDGNWFNMGYTDDGQVVGGHRCRQGKFFLINQVWAVIAGVATPEQRRRLFRAIDAKVQTPYGPLMNDKPFTRIDKSIGTLTFLAVGMNENAAMYMHTAGFKTTADGLAGRGDELYRDLTRVLPYRHDPAVTLLEPFALTNFYRPPFVPRKSGATHRSWCTTAHNWLLMSVVEGLMGVRATSDGIEVNPSLPKRWKGARLRRVLRGAVYDFEVRNPGRTGRGVRELWLDGTRVKGNLLPWPSDKRRHTVTVVLGG